MPVLRDVQQRLGEVAVLLAQIVEDPQRLTGEVAEVRVVALGLELGDHHDRQHDVVLGEAVQRLRIGQQHRGVQHVGDHPGLDLGEHLLGDAGQGFKLAMMTLDRTRPGVAAMATGIARAAFEFATNYSKERVQFGVPIAMHQGIQFMIADMATKVHLSRLATWNSAVLLDQGHRNTIESSHAKRFAADTAMEVSTDAVQVYGGYGFIKDYPVEKLMRDAKIMQLYEGTSQIQRLVIARETLLPRRIEEPAAV